MKKIFSAILMLSTIPAFATGVPSTETTADCDNTTLNTYTGTSNLQADWEANTIALHWYDGNTELTVPTESQTCTYDGILTPPSTIPTKTGYTFKGWQIPTYDFATIPVYGNNGIEGWAIGWRNNENICFKYNPSIDDTYRLVPCDSDETFQELNTNEWKVKTRAGDIYGVAKSSSKFGTQQGQPGTPNDTPGNACWRKVTGYKPGGIGPIRKPSSDLPWIYQQYMAPDLCPLSVMNSICVSQYSRAASGIGSL